MTHFLNLYEHYAMVHYAMVHYAMVHFKLGRTVRHDSITNEANLIFKETL